MRAEVDVRLAPASVGGLAPPPRSIVNGDEVGSAMSVCCLGEIGVSRLEVSLMVDEVTARRFSRSCRLERNWRRWGLRTISVAAGVILLLAVVGAMRDDRHLLSAAVLLSLVLASGGLASRVVLWSLRSRHHPRLERYGVVIRGVDSEVARVWVGLNPGGAIEILG